MARRRDVIIAVIIAVSFLIAIGFFGLIFIGLLAEDEGVAWGGFGEKVAVVEIYGTIYDSSSIVRQLKKWGDNSSVRAIVLHIDSPGGAVAPSQEIYNEILRVREEEGKIVVASMLSVAASGGYLISCAVDRIVANPGTITGSIGVVIQFPTVGELFDKIGIAYETVKSGELKDVGTLDRRMTKNEREMLTEMVMDTYEQFVDVVADGRGMDRDDVYDVADGSVFSGRRALELGLIDTLGSFEDAVRIAAEMAEIEGEPKVVREYKPKQTIWDLLGSLAGEIKEIGYGEINSPRVMYLY